MELFDIFKTIKPIIAMVHLKSLPGQPGFVNLESVYNHALSDIQILQNSGLNGLLFENWSENSASPLSKPETVNGMIDIILRLKPHINILFGVNVLNNDYAGAFKIAQKTGASFVQMDVLVDHVKSDFTYSEAGKNNPFEIDVDIHDVALQRQKYHQENTPIFTFIQPKHYQMLEKDKPIEKSATQAIRAGAQAVLITKATGFAPDISRIQKVKKEVGNKAWVGIGSGFSSKNANHFLPNVDFAVVGTDLKIGKITNNPVDETSARTLMAIAKKYQKITKIKIVSVGDTGADIYINQKKAKPGGIALNFALTASGNAETSLVSPLGKDEYGLKLQKFLKTTPLDISHIKVMAGKTPVQRIILEKTGERKFAGYNPGVLTTWKLTKKDILFIKNHDAIFVPLSDGMKHIFEDIAYLKTKAIKAADFSQDSKYADFNKKNNVITKYCKYFDINFIGATEAQKSLISTLSKKYPKKIFVLTLGGKGSIGFVNGKEFFQPAKKIKIVVDTTGAGDAFQAAFLVNYLQNHNIALALSYATHETADIIQKIGSTMIFL